VQLPRLLLLVAGISWLHLFPGQSLLVAGQEGPFLRPRSRCKLGNVPVSIFYSNNSDVGEGFQLRCTSFVSDIAIFVLKRDVKLQLTN